MNVKSFVFWSGVGIVILTGSYLLIRCFIKREEEQRAEQLANEAKKFDSAPRREAGFHSIAKDHAAAAA